MRDSLELMRGLGIEPNRVRVSGGGARSPFWCQMLADVFATEIATVSTSDGAAYGAALLGCVGAGAYETVGDAARSVVRVEQRVEPASDRGAYDRAYETYRSLYPALRDAFSSLAEE